MSQALSGHWANCGSGTARQRSKHRRPVEMHQRTTAHGLYAAGDVVSDLHQLSVAFGHAAIVVVILNHWRFASVPPALAARSITTACHPIPVSWIALTESQAMDTLSL